MRAAARRAGPEMPAELRELVALEPGVSPKEYWIEEASFTRNY